MCYNVIEVKWVLRSAYLLRASRATETNIVLCLLFRVGKNIDFWKIWMVDIARKELRRYNSHVFSGKSLD